MTSDGPVLFDEPLDEPLVEVPPPEQSPTMGIGIIQGQELTQIPEKTAGLKLLLDAKLRTEQLRYLNLQRCRALKNLRTEIRSLLKAGADPSQCPRMPHVRSPSIKVSDLRYQFDEATHCKWCDDGLTAENLALTFDLPISQGGSPEIENVVAICRSCFFHKGIYPQQFWAKLIEWLKQEHLLGVFRHYSPTWARTTAFRKHWAARRGRKR